MPTVRRAEVEWVGGFIDGEGKIISTTTGALPELEVTWQARVDEDQSLTSPEELLAAAGPDYTADDLRQLLGAQAGGLADLWLAWDLVQPVLFHEAAGGDPGEDAAAMFDAAPAIEQASQTSELAG